ncbi:MAG: histidine kinase dimerization/phosphoacceptor domain -containing protein [Methanobacterium sp.]|nr:histidine kinase dimerization/phosphoacceptor domain -containing protein [Methanobacterium sp.]
MNDEKKTKEQLINEIKKYRNLYSELEHHMADFNLMKPENKPFQDALQFLSPLVMELLNLPNESEIYDYILEKLQEVVKDAYIIISTYDEESDSLRVYKMIGTTSRMIDLAEKLTGVRINDLHFPRDKLDLEAKNFLSNGKLQKVDDGLYYITAGKLPQKTYNMLEKAFGVDKTYVMGFSLKGEMFGSVNIITKKNGKPLNINTVEPILNIASVVLQNKVAGKELKKRERLLSLVTDNMLNVVGQIDAEGTFQYISPSIKTILGYDPSEILGENVFQFINLTHPEDQIKVSTAFMGATNSYLPGEVQHRFRRADGSYIWVESLGNPLFDDENQYNGVVFSMTDINSLKAAEKNLKTSLEDKELLLRELHHRVKNNMQIISSLLNLQSQHIKDKRDLKIFKSSQTRVKTMSLIHEELYSSQDFSHIHLSKYIRNLTKELLTSNIGDPGRVQLTVNVEEIKMELETAIPLGLLINEIVANSVNHAFPNHRKGEIIVDLKRDGDAFVLKISDDGIGIPKKTDFEKAETLGFQLIKNLVNQLDGEIKMQTNHGTTFIIKFKELEYKKRF